SLRHLLIDCARIPRKGICNRVVQNRYQARSRVFRIDVDSVLSERAERDFRCSETGATCHRNAVCFEKLREHLAQEIRLAKRLGRDDDGRLLLLTRIHVWWWCEGAVGLAARTVHESIRESIRTTGR